MTDRQQGHIWVALQFGLLALLLGVPLTKDDSVWVAPGVWVCGLVGAVIGLWTLAFNRLGNFNIHPQPKQRGQLIVQGPYRWIRHPMYTAVLCVAAGLAWAWATPWVWPVWALLVWVLYRKSALEEAWLRRVHPAYEAYSHTAARFVPLVW